MLFGKGDGWWLGKWKAVLKIQRLQLWVVCLSVLKQESPMWSHFLQTPFITAQAKSAEPPRGKENIQGISSV